MSDGAKGRHLGRGLSALFGEDQEDHAELDSPRQQRTVPIELIRPNRYQPRRTFKPDDLDDLASSIATHGVLQPLIVRPDPDTPDSFELIAGERRWRAAQQAKLHEVPVLVRDLSDVEALEVAIIENIQRQDLNPVEEAEGYRRLMNEFSYTQEDLARAVGKSRSHVANLLRLLGLPDAVKEMVARGDLTSGHARALINAADPLALARDVIARALSVRQTEMLAKDQKPPVHRKSPGSVKDADTKALERELSNLIGLKVEIINLGESGRLTIRYATLEQLEEVIVRLGHKP